MFNEYLARLREEFHAFYEKDRTRALAAAGQIRKIVGEMTEAEEAHFFHREPAPEPAPAPAAPPAEPAK
jgi:hypothetical protein